MVASKQQNHSQVEASLMSMFLGYKIKSRCTGTRGTGKAAAKYPVNRHRNTPHDGTGPLPSPSRASARFAGRFTLCEQKHPAMRKVRGPLAHWNKLQVAWAAELCLNQISALGGVKGPRELRPAAGSRAALRIPVVRRTFEGSAALRRLGRRRGGCLPARGHPHVVAAQSAPLQVPEQGRRHDAAA